MVRKKRKLFPAFVSLIAALLLSASPVSAAEKPITVPIPVSCVGTNTTESFQYRLRHVGSEHQTMVSDVLRLSDGMTGNFEVSFDSPGTYHYTIQQDAGSDRQTSYDSTVYKVDVYVTDKMQAELVAYVSGMSEKKADIRFVNVKKVPTAGTAQKPAAPAKNFIARAVQTGDDASLLRYFLMLSGSLSLLIVMSVLKKRSWARR